MNIRASVEVTTALDESIYIRLPDVLVCVRVLCFSLGRWIQASCLRFGGDVLESDSMRTQLSTLATQLQKAVTLVSPVELTTKQQRVAFFDRVVSGKGGRFGILFFFVGRGGSLPSERLFCCWRSFAFLSHKMKKYSTAEGKYRHL